MKPNPTGFRRGHKKQGVTINKHVVFVETQRKSAKGILFPVFLAVRKDGAFPKDI